MIEAFDNPPMQRAFVGGLLAAVACGIIGVYTVVKKMAAISGGVSHASFGGIGIGYYFEMNPITAALLFTVASALGMGFAIRRTKLSQDVVIMAIWATGMALGVLLLFLTPGYKPDIATYLFGNVLLVSNTDLLRMAIIDVIIVFIVVLLYKEFLALSFDEEFGTVVGAPMRGLYYLLLCLVALTVVVVIKVIGVILITALLVLPVMTSKQLTHTLWKMMLLSIALGMLITTAGLWLAYELDLPPAPPIAFIGVALWLVSLAFSNMRNRRKTITASSESSTG